MKLKKLISHGVAVILGASVVVLVSSMTDEDLTRERDLYCEMLKLFESSNGKYGWPDYRDAKDSCV